MGLGWPTVAYRSYQILSKSIEEFSTPTDGQTDTIPNPICFRFMHIVQISINLPVLTDIFIFKVCAFYALLAQCA
jgi:hypothetical protein